MFQLTDLDSVWLSLVEPESVPAERCSESLSQRVNKCAANVVSRDKDPYERKALRNIVSWPDPGSRA
jgi:hypothetical protein